MVWVLVGAIGEVTGNAGLLLTVPNGLNEETIGSDLVVSGMRLELDTIRETLT